MTIIESNKLTINKTGEVLFRFLCDFNNFEKLLPEKVQNWHATNQTCSFTIEDMAAEIELTMGEHSSSEKIIYHATKKSPLDFSIITHIIPTSSNSTECQIAIHADLNPFVKIMVQKPLQKFVNNLIQEFKNVAESQL